MSVKFKFKLVEIRTPDNYCGYDHLCAEGGEQIFSFFLWAVILSVVFCLGACKSKQS